MENKSTSHTQDAHSTSCSRPLGHTREAVAASYSKAESVLDLTWQRVLNRSKQSALRRRQNVRVVVHRFMPEHIISATISTSRPNGHCLTLGPILFSILLHLGRGAKYCALRVCVYVCLSGRISQNDMSRLHDIFCTCYVWPWLRPPLLDIQARSSQGPSTSSLWIWRKSVQLFARYLIHKQKKHGEC